MKKDLVPPEIRERAKVSEGYKYPGITTRDRASLIRLIDEQLGPEIERLEQCHREGWLYAEEMKGEFERRGKEIERLRAALERISEIHNMYCEHHINVSSHSYDLARIADEVLTQLPTEGRDTEIVSPVKEEKMGKPV